MDERIDLRCDCGTVRGTVNEVSRANAQRVVCYCRSCRAYAERLGRTHELDALGGTDLVQTTSGRLSLTEGMDRIACMKMTPRGVLRWFATCCNAPISTCAPTPALPIYGIRRAALAIDEAALDRRLGPVSARVFASHAKGDVRTLGPGTTRLLPLILRNIRLVLRARRAGEHRRSPFFDPSGQPIRRPLPIPTGS